MAYFNGEGGCPQPPKTRRERTRALPWKGVGFIFSHENRNGQDVPLPRTQSKDRQDGRGDVRDRNGWRDGRPSRLFCISPLPSGRSAYCPVFGFIFPFFCFHIAM